MNMNILIWFGVLIGICIGTGIVTGIFIVLNILLLFYRKKKNKRYFINIKKAIKNAFTIQKFNKATDTSGEKT